jgi:hypothetical protein
MINLASEATVQQVSRAEQNQEVSHKETVQHETQKVLADRPVEKSKESEKATVADKPDEKVADKPDENETKYTLANNKIIIERYNARGDLILQTPPIHSDEI